MISAERKLVVTAAWTLTVLGAWSLVQRAAHAEEAPPPRQVRVELKMSGPGIPGLSQIPIIGRLFVNNDTAEASACCENKCNDGEVTCPVHTMFMADGLQFIGVDFDTNVCPLQKGTACCEKCVAEACPACPACPANGQCEVVAKGACQVCTTASCAALNSPCKQAECTIKTVSNEEKCAPEEPCQKLSCVVSNRVAGLVAENMSLNTALEVREQMIQLQMEMMERFAAMLAEKVRLESQLEFSEQLHAEREKHREKLDELAHENVRLKNMVELAEMRHQVDQSKIELAQENERLKQRVAELEIARRESKTDVRVAKKPRSTKEK